ncbi:MAG TPA: response regulator transcription factor [Actinomycetota bacterium]|nr:response regulator transcription factor [Actinomycetota bacterium]
MDTLSVLVVDETPGLTQDLLLCLRRRAGILVLGPVPDAAAALDALSDEPVDVVLVQLDRRDEAGIGIVATLRANDARVMVATRRTAGLQIELALAAGACGALPARGDGMSLAEALRRARRGELVLPADELPVLVDRMREARGRRAGRSLIDTLTDREREVLTALAEGATTADVSLELGISPATVQTHVKNILGKLGVHSKVEAVSAAWRAGLAIGSRSA